MGGVFRQSQLLHASRRQSNVIVGVEGGETKSRWWQVGLARQSLHSRVRRNGAAHVLNEANVARADGLGLSWLERRRRASQDGFGIRRSGAGGCLGRRERPACR